MPHIDMTGNEDKPRAMSYEDNRALIANKNGAVSTKKPISSVPSVDRIEFSPTVLAAVKTQNAALPKTPATIRNGDDRIIIPSAVRAAVIAQNAALPKTPKVRKGTPDRIDYDVRVTDIPDN
jgi:hypothetical protein